MSDGTHSDYYTSQSSRLLKDLDKFLKRMRKRLAERYGEEGTAALHRETLAEFERLIPQIPYIGGKENSLTPTLIQSAWALALYRVVQRHDGTVEEAGELIYRGAEAMFNRYPAFLRHLIGRFAFSKWCVRKMQQAARRSQKREYPGDWVWEVIEGDGETFDGGMDYTECGIAKFFHAQGADELTPYLCNLDYVTFRALGLGLKRTKTLGWGCDQCDFRIIKGGETPLAWPPTFPERNCGGSINNTIQ